MRRFTTTARRFLEFCGDWKPEMLQPPYNNAVMKFFRHGIHQKRLGVPVRAMILHRSGGRNPIHPSEKNKTDKTPIVSVRVQFSTGTIKTFHVYPDGTGTGDEFDVRN